MFKSSGSFNGKANHTRIIDLGWNRIINQTRALARSKVEIGLSPRFSGGDDDEGGLDEYTIEENVQHAIANEYGFPPTKLPERPFMREAVDKNREEISGFISNMIPLLNNGSLTVGGFFRKIGQRVKLLVKDSILNGNWQANSPKTIKKGPGTQPLIDTSQMIDNVRFRSTISHASELKTSRMVF